MVLVADEIRPCSHEDLAIGNSIFFVQRIQNRKALFVTRFHFLMR